MFSLVQVQETSAPRGFTWTRLSFGRLLTSGSFLGGIPEHCPGSLRLLGVICSTKGGRPGHVTVGVHHRQGSQYSTGSSHWCLSVPSPVLSMRLCFCPHCSGQKDARVSRCVCLSVFMSPVPVYSIHTRISPPSRSVSWP